jgi:hypothetical protein
MHHVEKTWHTLENAKVLIWHDFDWFSERKREVFDDISELHPSRGIFMGCEAS